jgi:ribosomal protein S1
MVNFVAINSIVNAKVVKITKTYILAMFDGFVGLCHISNVSDYIVKNLANFFVKNKNYDFLIIEKKANQIFLSYKAIHPKYLK